ncbi:MAG: hypothetical protein ACRDE8_05840 [Ginsengibacter sp.]
MIFWNKICGFILFLILSSLFSSAQNTESVKLNYNTFLLKNKLNSSDTVYHTMPLFTYRQNLKSPVSENFSTCTYGFFCREELKIEKVTKIPVRFRLGSLEQCNYYEGKKQ